MFLLISSLFNFHYVTVFLFAFQLFPCISIVGLRNEPDLMSEKYMDLTELLGIAGVPTFLFIHPEGTKITS